MVGIRIQTMKTVMAKPSKTNYQNSSFGYFGQSLVLFAKQHSSFCKQVFEIVLNYLPRFAVLNSIICYDQFLLDIENALSLNK